MIDSIPRNVAAYAGYLLLAVVIGILSDIHRQIANGNGIDWVMVGDAAIVVLVPVLITTLGNMKLPSVGSEKVADKVQDVRESLRVETPAEHRAEVGGKG